MTFSQSMENEVFTLYYFSFQFHQVKVNSVEKVMDECLSQFNFLFLGLFLL